MVKKATKTEHPAAETAAEESKSLARVISEGASDACAAATNAFPAAGKALRKSIYTGFYYVTYGVVFSSLAVASLIPTDNAMGEGSRAGAAAARKDFGSRKEAVEEGAAKAAAAA